MVWIVAVYAISGLSGSSKALGSVVQIRSEGGDVRFFEVWGWLSRCSLLRDRSGLGFFTTWLVSGRQASDSCISLGLDLCRWLFELEPLRRNLAVFVFFDQDLLKNLKS